MRVVLPKERYLHSIPKKFLVICEMRARLAHAGLGLEGNLAEGAVSREIALSSVLRLRYRAGRHRIALETLATDYESPCTLCFHALLDQTL